MVLSSVNSFNSSVLMSKVDDDKSIILQFDKRISYVALSPFEASHELVIVVFPELMCIGTIRFKEEYSSLTDLVGFSSLQKIYLPDVHKVCWSPESTLSTAPYIASFASTSITEINKIRVFKANLSNEYTEKILVGHRKYVNDLAFEPDGVCLASVSDDLTCKVWNTHNNYEVAANFYLLSPGMVVCWHKTIGGLLLVGEKIGTIRMYNVTKSTALLSFQTDHGCLTAISWLPGETSYIAALCGSYLVVWKTSWPSSAYRQVEVHPDGGRHVLFGSGVVPKVFSIGAPGNTLKCTTIDKGMSNNIASLKVVSNMTAYSTLPYIAVGVDRAIHIYKTTDY